MNIDKVFSDNIGIAQLLKNNANIYGYRRHYQSKMTWSA